jgi:hypothetical protein
VSRQPSTIPDRQVPTRQMQGDVSGMYRSKKGSPSTGDAKYALGLARVMRVDYARHQIQLQILSGENDWYQWTAMPAGCPGAGARHFIGSLPEPGDVCVIGWLSGDSKTPIILTYMPIAVGSGNEWTPFQSFLPTEVDMNPQTRAHYEGIYGRYRHKMRSMRPGCICLSSSQGSDIMLDEGVLITNRRATEIRLRDQDQAIVMRSMQQFHVMGGARVYAGMVQRDAQFLPSRMFSDGTDWAAGVQVDSNGAPLAFEDLPASSVPAGALTPHDVFVRSDSTLPFRNSGISIDDNVDPYSFLKRGFFIGSDGFVFDSSRALSSAEYGGKPMWRVAIDPNPENTAFPSNSLTLRDGTEVDTLTEYRIEMDHSWDGTLPVSEQTDGFDADRLPNDSVLESASASNGPYLQWVLGSVVGNDAFTDRGRELYGLPLVPQIFSETKVDPRMQSGLGLPLGEHAASLFRVDAPIADPSTIPPMFVSTTKDGRVKGFLSGPQDQNSLELALNGGMRMQANGPMVFDAANIVFNFRNGDPTNNYAAVLTSDTGAIAIRGNAPTTQGSFSARTTSTDIQENNFPAVLIESPSGNTHIKSGRFTKVSGANGIQLVDTNEVLVTAKQSINMFADKALLQCNTRDKTVQGKEVQLYSGPKNFLPTNAPMREIKFISNPLTGHAGGRTDSYFMLFGDRVERFVIGNHRTTVAVGNLTYQTALGSVTHRAGVNQIRLGTADGISMFSATTTSMFSTLSTTINALASVTVRAVGRAKLSGIVTTLGGAGAPGRILSSTDRDPLTNLPFSFFGLGSTGHRLGLPI